MKNCEKCGQKLVSVTGLADFDVHDLDKKISEDHIENIYVRGTYCPACCKVKYCELG